MQNKSNLLLAVAATSLISMSASAAVITSWSMTTAVPAATTGTSYNYGVADSDDLASGTMLSSGLAIAATTRDNNVPAPAPEVGDWRDDWRRNRNLMIELNPALEYDPTSVMVMFVRGTSEKQKALIRDAIGGMTVET